jgi:hypothetical protein
MSCINNLQLCSALPCSCTYEVLRRRSVRLVKGLANGEKIETLRALTVRIGEANSLEDNFYLLFGIGSREDNW